MTAKKSNPASTANSEQKALTRFLLSMSTSAALHGTLIAGLIGAPTVTLISTINSNGTSVDGSDGSSIELAQVNEVSQSNAAEPTVTQTQIEPVTATFAAAAPATATPVPAAPVALAPVPQPQQAKTELPQKAKPNPIAAAAPVAASALPAKKSKSVSKSETPMPGTISSENAEQIAIDDPESDVSTSNSSAQFRSSDDLAREQDPNLKREAQPLAATAASAAAASRDSKSNVTATETASSRLSKQMEATVAQSEQDLAQFAETRESDTVTMGMDKLSEPAAAPAAQPAAEASATQAAANSGAASGTSSAAGPLASEIREARVLKAMPGNPMPAYPSQDRLRKQQGTSVIVGRIDQEGRVTKVILERSSGSSSMDQASIEAFKKWKFKPGQEGWVRNPFQFRLVGEAKELNAVLGKQTSSTSGLPVDQRKDLLR